MKANPLGVVFGFIILINSVHSIIDLPNNDLTPEEQAIDNRENMHGIFSSFEDMWNRIKVVIGNENATKAETAADNAPNKPESIKTVAEDVKTNWKQDSSSSQSLIEIKNGVKIATHRIELSGKSYIRPVSSSDCLNICPHGTLLGIDWIDPICVPIALTFCASMNPTGVISNRHESYGPSGNQRFYSKVIFEITCENNIVTSAREVERHQSSGKEGPLQAPPAEFDRMIAKVENNIGHIGYMCSARPHRGAEVGMQGMRFRTCTWIWHFPYYKINTCDEAGWSGEFLYGGSSFPTRRLWRDGTLKDTTNQRSIENLWISSSSDRALINGWFPYNFDY